METSIKAVKRNLTVEEKKITWRKIKEQKYLIFMSLPFVIWLVIFKYLPLTGWLMAFQDYKPGRSAFEQKWVGLKHFKVLFNEPQFYQSMTNTLGMSFLAIIFGFLIPITFAILLNELKAVKFKKIVQTISYLPHFVSWVIIAGIVTTILAPDGAINALLIRLGFIDNPINYMTKPDMFWGIVTASDVWKETGWNAIIYLAAIAGIDQELYEAAKIDGANRFKQILHITLPGIRPTFIVLLILSIGNLINIGFEKQFLLGNNIVADKSLVIDKYALDYGIGMFRYSYGTAIGIFKSVVSIILVLFANLIARKTGVGRVI